MNGGQLLISAESADTLRRYFNDMVWCELLADAAHRDAIDAIARATAAGWTESATRALVAVLLPYGLSLLSSGMWDVIQPHLIDYAGLAERLNDRMHAKRS